MRETQIRQALRALAEHDRDMGAPPEVETRSTLAFRARQAKRASRFRRAVSWTAIGSAAAALVIFAIVNWPATGVPKPSGQAAVTPSPAAAPQAERQEIPAVRRPSVPAVARRIHKPAPMEELRAREVVTDFFPLMEPAPPFERGEILRVELPAAAMQAVGLPVGDDHLADQIQADVVVGEEGLPRAIRFVRFEMK